MRTLFKRCAIAGIAAMLTTGIFADERPIVPADRSVTVQFQLKQEKSNSWTMSSATLKGAVSESMMVNELSRRYSNCQIRILSADYGKTVQVQVRYQLSRDGKSWSSGSTTLRNALTESMARNQISRSYPGSQVRITGIAVQ